LPEAAGSRWALDFLRGTDLQSLGSFTAAAAEFKQAIHLNPGFAEAHLNLGRALGAQGQHAAAIAEFNEAIREFKETIRLNPYDAAAHLSLGDAFDAQPVTLGRP
jgi:tetratricopeptide (TPR) repeat protein